MKTGRISLVLESRIRAQARNRCGYCLAPQELIPAPLEIEHIVPRASGGSNDEENLWLACRLCNLYKSDKTVGYDPVSGRKIQLFNPRTQGWTEHFQWSEDGASIIGLTACGRATVEALHLNNVHAIAVRYNWISAGWHPPTEE